MNVSHENAQESLSTIQDVTVRTHRAIASAYANPFMILWGVLCITAFNCKPLKGANKKSQMVT